MRTVLSIIATVSLGLMASGCAKPLAPDADASRGQQTSPAAHHAHPSEGPHQGTLVELGNEEFHAEVVHAEESVTVYILDSTAKNLVPVDAAEVFINLTVDGKPQQYRLEPIREAGQSGVEASQFSIVDRELSRRLDDASANPKLTINIDGAPYRGEIHHTHSDAGHGHPH